MLRVTLPVGRGGAAMGGQRTPAPARCVLFSVSAALAVLAVLAAPAGALRAAGCRFGGALGDALCA
ncbi:hypothetical protein STXM2123_4422 [Streptomyces sp. F-3]|nr:hypothetical protein STXM2123_4422 [Streptomyces sp. F-3]